MHPENYLLPSNALPGLINVMLAFNLALKSQIQEFELTQNKVDFEKKLVNFRRDLVGFMQNFDHMHENAASAQDFQQVEQLAKLFDDGQILVVKGTELLKHAD